MMSIEDTSVTKRDFSDIHFLVLTCVCVCLSACLSVCLWISVCLFLCVQLLFFVVMLAKVHRESVKLLREGSRYVRNVWNVIEVCVKFLGPVVMTGQLCGRHYLLIFFNI